MPVKRKMSPRKRKMSPKKTKRKMSPRKRKISPKKTKRKMSPRKRTTSPKKISRKKRLNPSPFTSYYNTFMNEYFPNTDESGNLVNIRQTGFLENPLTDDQLRDLDEGYELLSEIEIAEARKLTDEITNSALQKARSYLLNHREAIELAVEYRLKYFNDLETGYQKFIDERKRIYGRLRTHSITLDRWDEDTVVALDTVFPEFTN